jgi:hypothetical protein
MKVLTATVVAWLLHNIGGLVYDLACKLIFWGDDVQDWAGIGPDPDDYKVGGSD